MAKETNIFIIIPDGVGVRNFAYGHFPDAAARHGLNVRYFNITGFPLSEMGYPEIRVRPKVSPWTFLYKTARNHIELKRNQERSGNDIYASYLFPMGRTLRPAMLFKQAYINMLVKLFASEKGLRRLKRKVEDTERKTVYYQACRDIFQQERPDLVFCTNQRHVTTVAPIVAARDLGIRTACFIFSWDNLPKATVVIDTDFYFVWSDHMKRELEHYAVVGEDRVKVTGTPQFEVHYDRSMLLPRGEFCARHGLDPQCRYICFTGDDVTTSPDDPGYLRDVAMAVRALNSKGHKLGLLFRRCPVDFSGRYKTVVSEFADVISEIAPQWNRIDSAWNAVLPGREDSALLANTIAHSEMAINLGSSVVFDCVAHGKPCAYINYNQPEKSNPKWDVRRCYRLIHFQSMPSADAVLWIGGADEIAPTIEKALSGRFDLSEAEKWFAKINQPPAGGASERIAQSMKEIARKR
jgi:hypothetical protein